METGGAPAPATFFVFSVWLCLVSQLARSLPSPVSSNSNSSITHETALLSFKSALYSSSFHQLDSWNSSTHFCRWPGVVCGRRHPERVVALRMGSFNLSGPISPSLGNLSFLREVHLDINSLTGEIPPELSHLGRLEFLNLSSNQLHGEIPASLGTMANLYILDLEENHLSGEIPVSLASLPSIGFLFLYSNMLTGEIPPELGNLTGLMHLDLMENMLSGPIPPSLGTLSSLIWLSLANNTLGGEIPASIWNLYSLWGINVQQNNLTGAIPANAFGKLANLVSVSMDNNRFHGHLPASLANATQLQLLQLGPNSFTGVVPRQIGALTKLQWLLLSNTLVGAEEPADWKFLKAMANCSQLVTLDLTAGRFAGVLPASSLSSQAVVRMEAFEAQEREREGDNDLERFKMINKDSTPKTLCVLSLY